MTSSARRACVYATSTCGSSSGCRSRHERPCSPASASTFVSRLAIDDDLASGALAVAQVDGLEPSREISLVRSTGRAETRVAQAFVAFARERLG